MDKMQRALAVLNETFGYPGFRQGQDEIVEKVLSGRDLLGVMPTGGGKSLCYQVPALVAEGVCIVISPLISLMKDQVDALERKNVAATFLNSNLESDEIIHRMQAIRQGKYKLVYVAPERLQAEQFLELLKRIPLSFIAIDESHCISQWGHDFRPAYTKIDEALEAIDQYKGKRIQRVALTATATDEVRADIAKQLDMKDPFIMVKGFDRKNLTINVVHASSKRDGLIHEVGDPKDDGIIVYCSSRKKVDQMTTLLQNHGYRAAGYHGGMSSEERNRVQEQFLKDEVGVMVATNAFGMGVDKPNVRKVIHVEMPGSVEGYYQEAGRGGRDGEEASCTLLYSPHDRRLHEFLIDASLPPTESMRSFWELVVAWPEDYFDLDDDSLMTAKPKIKKNMIESCYRTLQACGTIEMHKMINEDGVEVTVAAIVDRSAEPDYEHISRRRLVAFRQLDAMERFCNTSRCRRHFLLNYFGEKADKECGKCDLCIERRKLRDELDDVSDLARVAIDCIASQNSRITAVTLAKILAGIRDMSVIGMGLDKSDFFARLSGLTQDQTHRLVDILMQDQYLVTNGNAKGFLFPSAKGLAVLNQSRKVYAPKGELTINDNPQSSPVPDNGASAAQKGQSAVRRLDESDLARDIKALQEELADEMDVAPFMIWGPVTTKSLLDVKPVSLAELSSVRGMTDKKIKLFGERLVGLFAA